MEALLNEKLLLESDNKQIRLTTHRIRYHETPSRNSNFTSIMLDKVCAIELTYYKPDIWLLILGILTIPIIVGIIIIYLYFTSKKHVVSISAAGGKPIVFETKGMKREFLEKFVDKVEQAALELKKLI